MTWLVEKVFGVACDLYMDGAGIIDHDKYEILATAAEKLGKYESEEDKGRLIKIPVSVGDTVWAKRRFWSPTGPYEEIREFKIVSLSISQNKKKEWKKSFRASDGDGWLIDFAEAELNKVAFLTLEEIKKQTASNS